ncbi:WSC-domain-containing protein [Serendipita vermifera]|nr:WSC-domain-containing protein [Serendipita vermifera]
MASPKITALFSLVILLHSANAFFFELPSFGLARRHGSMKNRSLHASKSAARRDTEINVLSRAPSNESGWTHVGCITDLVDARTLSAASYSTDDMTNAKCQSLCEADGYVIAATEWGRECWCDNEIHNHGNWAGSIECDFPCTGDSDERCGGGLRMTMWAKGVSVLQSYNQWSASGCYVDSAESRILPTSLSIRPEEFTAKSCLDACSAEGFEYAGLEYMHECYCASGVDVSTFTPKDMSECNSLCEGDPSHFCGAGDRLILYQTGASKIIQNSGAWSFQSCYSDSTSDRTLSTQVGVEGDMTVDKCVNKCSEGGFKYAGVKYANECYCSNTIGGSGAPVDDGCDMPCSGDNTAICGGGNRLALYQRTDPVVLESYKDWTSQGCYVDQIGSRQLPNSIDISPMTVEGCLDACADAGYTIAGLEYASECYCGTTLPTLVANEGCDMACTGDFGHLCGGGNRLNVYQARTRVDTITASIPQEEPQTTSVSIPPLPNPTLSMSYPQTAT